MGAVLDSGSLHYRRGGDSNYVTAALAPSLQVAAIGTIPGSAVGPRGVDYWVAVWTATSVSPLTFPASHPEATPDNLRVTVKSLREPDSHPGLRYRMLGMPLDFGSGPPGLIELLSGQLGRYDPVEWRAFRYRPDLGLNWELDATDSAVPSSGFWLITRDGHRINTGLQPGLSTSTRAEYPIALAQGWNQIANPFDFPVAWASVRRPAGIGSPLAFDPTMGSQGGYKDAEILEPFEGYFIFDSVASETLFVPPVAVSTSVAKALGPADRGVGDASWRLQLTAQTENAEDASNVIGVDPAAAEGRDGLDLPKPPCPPGAWVTMGLRLPGDPATAKPCRADLRPPSGEGHAWEIELRSETAGEPITLDAQWTTVPRDTVKLRLIDRELGGAFDLGGGGSTASYRLLSPGPDRPYRLTLLAGSDKFIAEGPAADIAIPGRLVIDPVVPNPSRAAVRIRYGLPQAREVTIEIMDVLGRRVAVVQDRVRGRAGYHAVLWDGLDTGGRLVRSGIYFCRLSSGDGVLTKRIARLD